MIKTYNSLDLHDIFLLLLINSLSLLSLSHTLSNVSTILLRVQCGLSFIVHALVPYSNSSCEIRESFNEISSCHVTPLLHKIEPHLEQPCLLDCKSVWVDLEVIRVE